MPGFWITLSLTLPKISAWRRQNFARSPNTKTVAGRTLSDQVIIPKPDCVFYQTRQVRLHQHEKFRIKNQQRQGMTYSPENLGRKKANNH